MAQKLYDLVVKTGSYTNAQGEQKSRFLNVGVVLQGDNGPYMMLNKTFNPAGVPDERGGESVIVSMFEPKPTGQQTGQSQGGNQQQPQQGGGFQQGQGGQGPQGFDSPIPF